MNYKDPDEKRSNNKHTDEAIDLHDLFDTESFPMPQTFRVFFFRLIFTLSLFLASIILVWYASTDSQRAQTNLFIQQALQGNIDFTILQNTKFQALDYFEWPWETKKEKLKHEVIKRPQPIYPRTVKVQSLKSSGKYQNLYSCSSKPKHLENKKRVYKCKNAEGQLHMSDRFPKSKDYHDLVIQDLDSESFFLS